MRRSARAGRARDSRRCAWKRCRYACCRSSFMAMTASGNKERYRSRRMFAKLSIILKESAIAHPSPRAARIARRVFVCAALIAPLAALASGAASSAPGSVDAARLQAADSEPQNWFTGGRDKDGTYYSPLKLIDAKNVKDLGFAWGYDLGTPQRGQEATPIVIDGVLYTSGTWGYVYAVDAASGRELWRYDPKADYAAARNPCCDLVNRSEEHT